MFISGFNYNTDEYLLDKSTYNGIPREYTHLRNKKFDNWEIPPWQLFIFKDRLLGQGSFSDVYLAKWRETFVVAKILKPDVNKTLILREIDIMSKLHHPNIVQFLGYINEPFIIIMEYIPNGSLKSNIKKLNIQKKIEISKDILRGLIYLHNRIPNSLIHRDIKLSNILLTNSKVAKITDFGLSKFYYNENLIKSNSIDKNLSEIYNNELTNEVGTDRYMAPELRNNNGYTNKIDIYSCGILLYELFENKIHNVNSALKFYWTPKKIKSIIINMTNQDPNCRPNAINILKSIN